VKLRRAQLEGLLGRLGGRLATFDTEQARRKREHLRGRRRSAALTQGHVDLQHHTADGATSVIELRLDRFEHRRRGALTRIHRNLERRIAWRALRSEARRFPEHQALQDLLAAETELLELMDHPELERE